MSCPACSAAAVKPLTHGTYWSACKGCSARMLAHGQDFWRSQTADQLTPVYRQLLIDTWGADWQQGHAEVKRWAKLIDAERRPNPNPQPEVRYDQDRQLIQGPRQAVAQVE